MRRAFRKSLILCAALPLAAVGACSDASYETEEAAVAEAASDFEGDAMMAEETAEAVADTAAGPDASLPQLGALEVSLPPRLKPREGV